jgi:CBS domain-containing protein
MKIHQIMTRGVRSCTPSDSLATAARIMWEADCGVVPVIDAEARVVGIVTDRDLCMAAYTQGALLSQITVGSIATHEVHTVHEDDSIDVAEHRMREHRVRRLPVLDDGGRLAGIVSINDLARHARAGWGRDATTPDDLSRTLAMISEHRVAEPRAAE